MASAANCTLTGNLTLINSNAGAGSSVMFATPHGLPQNAQGTIIPFSQFTVYADNNGNLPAGVMLPFSAVAQVQICGFQHGTFQCNSPFQIQVPDQSTADLTTLYLAQHDPPSIVTGLACTGCSSLTNPPPGAAGIASFTVAGGTGFPLTANVSATGFEINNLGTDTSTGDALSRFQSTLNSLAVPTSSVPMNSQKFTGLTAGTATGDSLAFGLNTLASLVASNVNLNNHTLSGISTLTVGQGGLSGWAGSIVLQTSPSTGSATLKGGFSSANTTVIFPSSNGSSGDILTQSSSPGTTATLWSPSPLAMLTGSANATVSTSVANVFPISGNGTPVATTSEGTVSNSVPFAGVLSNLSCFLTTAGGVVTVAGGTKYTVAVRQNLSTGTLTCDITTAISSCQDTTAGHNITFAANDQLDFIATPSGTPTALIPHCSVQVTSR